MRKITVESDVATKLGLEPGDYEVHEITKGVSVFSFLGKSEEKKSGLTNDELVVLKKLSLFKFESRIPFSVNKSLSEQEKKLLEGLIKRGFVELYKQGKYAKTGVYNIPKNLYPLIRDTKIETPQSAPAKKLTGVEMLQKYGYAIIENEMEARDLSRFLEKQIRAGDYLGIRGFNKKFYIAEKNYYISLSERIRKLLTKKDATVEQLATELKVTDDASAVAIMLMNNESEVIEKKKGMYGLV